MKDAYLAANADRFLFGAAVSNNSGNDHSASLLNIDTSADKLSAAIVTLAKMRALEADPHIRPFKVDDGKGREFFVLIEGSADVRRNGRKINAMGAGDFFGEIALVSNRARTATVTATSPGWTSEVSHHGLGHHH